MVAFSLGSMEGIDGRGRAVYTAGLMALSAATVTAYIAYARRRPRPLFRLGLFRDETFSIGLVGNLVSRIGSSGVTFLLPCCCNCSWATSPSTRG